MSKSKGEFTRLKTLVEKGIKPVEYRYWLLQAQYSSQVQYTEEAVLSASAGYRNLISHISSLLGDTVDVANDGVAVGAQPFDALDVSAGLDAASLAHWNTILEIISDNLNTPKCIAELWELVRNTSISNPQKLSLVAKIDGLLGLDLLVNAELQKNKTIARLNIPEHINLLLEKRKAARLEKNWKLSDEIREEIKGLGYEVLDSEIGQTILKI
jgi:cysteinyl-tRNA synthetase